MDLLCHVQKKSYLRGVKQDYAYTELADAKAMLKVRDPEGHKGTFGHGLLVAGCKGMAGAAILSARAALRSGMGKLTVHTDEFNLTIIQVAVPEAVIEPRVKSQISNFKLQISNFDSFAIGPGLGQSETTHKLLLSVLQQKPPRLVIDADGLNLLSQTTDWPTLLPKNTVLTPHPKEWERLAGNSDPLEYAQRYGLYIILKGHATRIYTPQGTVFVNTTGNSGMATAGSGDVLTGILLSLLAQGYSHEDACRLGVWLHGKAGDIAAAELTPQGMIASVEHLPKAFKSLNIEQ